MRELIDAAKNSRQHKEGTIGWHRAVGPLRSAGLNVDGHVSLLLQFDAALAAKDAEIERLRNAVLWALGEVGEFPPNPASPDAKGIQRRPYYWRTELRSRAFGERNSGGTPE